MPFTRFAADMLAAGDNTILDYNVVFAPFREAFGSHVHVFPMERSSLPDGLAAHFLAQIGAPAHPSESLCTPRANVRRGAKEIEVHRVLRARLSKWQTWRKPKLPDLTAVIDDDSPFRGFARADIRALEARFDDANRRFALAYSIDSTGALFRDTGDGAGRRPNVARWEQFDAAERARIRRHVRDRIGIDLDGGIWNLAMYGLLDTNAMVKRRLHRARRRGLGHRR